MAIRRDMSRARRRMVCLAKPQSFVVPKRRHAKTARALLPASCRRGDGSHHRVRPAVIEPGPAAAEGPRTACSDAATSIAGHGKSHRVAYPHRVLPAATTLPHAAARAQPRKVGPQSRAQSQRRPRARAQPRPVLPAATTLLRAVAHTQPRPTGARGQIIERQCLLSLPRQPSSPPVRIFVRDSQSLCRLRLQLGHSAQSSRAYPDEGFAAPLEKRHVRHCRC